MGHPLAVLLAIALGSGDPEGNFIVPGTRGAIVYRRVDGQELNLDAFFTPREALELQAGLYGVPKAERATDEILNAVGLLDKADAYSRSLSGGMRRRLLVAKIGRAHV